MAAVLGELERHHDVDVPTLAGHRGGRRVVHRRTLRRFVLRRAMRHGERVPEPDVDELLAGAAAHGPLGPLIEGTCPIRIAWAEHDHVVPWRHYGRPFLATVPQAQFVRLPGCGHLPMWDDPELVGRVILQVSSAACDADRRGTR